MCLSRRCVWAVEWGEVCRFCVFAQSHRLLLARWVGAVVVQLLQRWRWSLCCVFLFVQVGKLRKVLSNPSEDSDGPFQRRLDALITFRRLLLHHADAVCSLPRQDLFAITSGVLISVNSLRSEAVKNGLMTLNTMYRLIGAHADCVVDQVRWLARPRETTHPRAPHAYTHVRMLRARALACSVHHPDGV